MNINITLVGEMITFALLVFVTMKYIWPPITKAMDERQKKIADGLEAGARGEKSLELAQGKIKNQLQNAKKEAASIIDGANKKMMKIIKDAKDQADKEGKRIISLAQIDIAQEMEVAKEKLKDQVAQLVISASEKLLREKINQQTDRLLIDKLIAEIS